MRVLRLIARMNLGGPAYNVSLLSGLLDPSRYETLLVAGSTGRGEASADELARRYGAKLVKIDALGAELRPKADLDALIRLVALIRRFRPDIVHTHTAKAGFIGRLAAVSAVRPRPIVVHTYHGHVLEGYFHPAVSTAYRRLEWLSGTVSDALIGVSQQTVDDLIRMRIAPSWKFHTIRLGVDLDPFLNADAGAGKPFRRELGVSPHEILVTFVGRLVPIKRVDLALKVVAAARRQGAPIRLAIVGDGELRSELEDLSATLGLGNAVEFLGYREDMPAVATGSDIALLTSANEGTPVWLIEAAAAGRPAVATSVGGVPEVVCSQCGRALSTEDERTLAAALVDLAQDDHTRREMGACARAHVQERFSTQRLVDEMDDLYQQLLLRRLGHRASRV